MQSIKLINQTTNEYFVFYDNYLGTILHDFVGFESPEIKAAIDDVSGPLGAHYVTSKSGPRHVSFQADIVSSDVYTLRRTLSSVLRQTGQMKLIQFTTYDGLTLQFEAEVTKYLNPYTHGVHQLLIELLAPDFRFYSQIEHSYDLVQTIVQGGAAIPAAIPLAIVGNASNLLSTRIITNAGNEETFPKFTIPGPGTGFTISNVVTGKSFVLSSTLTDSDTVVIDTHPLKRTVVKNGTDNLYPDFSGDFWSLAPGENEINFIVGSGAGVTTLLNNLFRDAYSGL